MKHKINDIIIKLDLLKDEVHCSFDNCKLEVPSYPENHLYHQYQLTFFEAKDEYDDYEFKAVGQIGHIILSYIDVELGQYKGDMSAHSVFDYRDEDVYRAYQHLYDKNGELNDEFRGFANDNFIYIDDIFIEPKYRNMGIGTEIVRNINNMIRYLLKLNVGCIFLFARPSEKDTEGEILRIMDNKSQQRLIKFYKNCGFQRIKNTGYMYHNTDYALS